MLQCKVLYVDSSKCVCFVIFFGPFFGQWTGFSNNNAYNLQVGGSAPNRLRSAGLRDMICYTLRILSSACWTSALNSSNNCCTCWPSSSPSRCASILYSWQDWTISCNCSRPQSAISIRALQGPGQSASFTQITVGSCEANIAI